MNLDLSLAAVKAWVESRPVDEVAGIVQECESCLIANYIKIQTGKIVEVGLDYDVVDHRDVGAVFGFKDNREVLQLDPELNALGWRFDRLAEKGDTITVREVLEAEIFESIY